MTAPTTTLSRARSLLSPGEWRRMAAMSGFIVLLHLIGWLTLLTVAAPGTGGAGATGIGVGIGVTAYTLGVRHAFDADHIAAIDNTTRKLMDRRERPLSVGFWFSLGHSSVVFVLALILAAGAKSVVGPLRDDSSDLHRLTGLIGTTVSACFLYLIAAVNLAALAGIRRALRGRRDGTLDDTALQDQLDRVGLMNRLLARATRSISRPWQMYPLGLLFGLGFDTATEVALLVLAASGAASGLPWYAIMCLPVLFAAGMCLFDTIDGTFMNFAYGWAFADPLRKVRYNLAVTGLSVAVALVVGTVELLALLAERLSLGGPFWDGVSGIDLNTAGFAAVALFVAGWLLALAWQRARPTVPVPPAGDPLPPTDGPSMPLPPHPRAQEPARTADPS